MCFNRSESLWILAGIVALGAGQAARADDPPACRLVNKAFTEKWVMKITDKFLPVGTIKIYEAGTKNQLGTIKSSGDTFPIGRKQSLDLVISPTLKGIGITLTFYKDGDNAAPCSTINIKQLVGSNSNLTDPAFDISAQCSAVKFNPEGYQRAGRGDAFIEVGR